MLLEHLGIYPVQVFDTEERLLVNRKLEETNKHGRQTVRKKWTLLLFAGRLPMLGDLSSEGMYWYFVYQYP